MTADAVLQKLTRIKKSGTGWIARCPAHEDRSPSLSITEKNGRILLYCHAGCTAEAICKALGIQVRDLFTEPMAPQKRLPPAARLAQSHLSELRSRLTPRDREKPVTIVQADRMNPDAAMARALALAVEGELCQVVFEDEKP